MGQTLLLKFKPKNSFDFNTAKDNLLNIIINYSHNFTLSQEDYLLYIKSASSFAYHILLKDYSLSLKETSIFLLDEEEYKYCETVAFSSVGDVYIPISLNFKAFNFNKNINIQTKKQKFNNFLYFIQILFHELKHVSQYQQLQGKGDFGYSKLGAQNNIITPFTDFIKKDIETNHLDINYTELESNLLKYMLYISRNQKDEEDANAFSHICLSELYKHLQNERPDEYLENEQLNSRHSFYNIEIIYKYNLCNITKNYFKKFREYCFDQINKAYSKLMEYPQLNYLEFEKIRINDSQQKDAKHKYYKNELDNIKKITDDLKFLIYTNLEYITASLEFDFDETIPKRLVELLIEISSKCKSFYAIVHFLKIKKSYYTPTKQEISKIYSNTINNDIEISKIKDGYMKSCVTALEECLTHLEFAYSKEEILNIFAQAVPQYFLDAIDNIDLKKYSIDNNLYKKVRKKFLNQQNHKNK